MLAFGPAIHANPVLRGANIFEALLLNFLVDKHIIKALLNNRLFPANRYRQYDDRSEMISQRKKRSRRFTDAGILLTVLKYRRRIRVFYIDATGFHYQLVHVQLVFV